MEIQTEIVSEVDITQYKVDMFYLIKIMLLSSLSCTHFGFALAQTNACISSLQF